MALPYKVWNEDEIKNRNVSPEGDYPFNILAVTRKRTKPKLGDDGQLKQTYEMLELEMQFHDSNGIAKTIKDWIVFMDGMDWKFRHLADTIGQLHLYEAGTLDCPQLMGKTGVISLGVKESIWNGEVRKQNHVKDYVKKDRTDSNLGMPIPAVSLLKKDGDFINDSIPF